MRMTWHDLLFMHWPLAAELLQPHIPPTLELELYHGTAWVGVIPFHMTDVRPAALPGFMASAFPEVNVRTYVRYKGRSGVWFFSLDAADRMAVWAARRFFHLPYHHAEMSSVSKNGVVEYRSRRRSNPEIAFVARYAPTGEVQYASPGSLEHWLTERYSLFSVDRRGRMFRVDVEHQPWPLQPAEADVAINRMTLPLRVDIATARPLLHFAKRLDVESSRLQS